MHSRVIGKKTPNKVDAKERHLIETDRDTHTGLYVRAHARARTHTRVQVEMKESVIQKTFSKTTGCVAEGTAGWKVRKSANERGAAERRGWLTGRADRMPSHCHWHLKGRHTLRPHWYVHPLPLGRSDYCWKAKFTLTHTHKRKNQFANDVLWG